MKFKLEDLNDLLIDGEWDWRVIESIETMDKKGKPRFEMICEVADINGKIGEAKAWVPLWKLEEFCRSGGLDAEFEKREVTPQDCLRASGKCIGKIEIGTMGDRGKYPDKNVIVNFLPPKPKNDFINDDIKF